MKNCILCKHFNLDFGEANYSELTPGNPCEVTCSKQKYYHSGHRDCQENWQKAIKTAETCEEYEEA